MTRILLVRNSLKKTFLFLWKHECVSNKCAQRTNVHTDKPVHTYNPYPSKEKHSMTEQVREASLKVFYGKASTFLPNDPIYAAVCGGKEPLREESLITGTQCPEGALQFKTHPSISTHTTLTLFACYYLDYMRNLLC